jgi:probable O-glycosylation ligase (exosortase A-associated)
LSIRDLIVTAVVLGTLPFVLRHAYIGVLLWTWLSIMNPHKLAWGFATEMPFAAMAAGATLVSLITTRDRVRLPSSGIVAVLMLLVAWTGLTTLMAFDPAGSWISLKQVLKIQLMTLVAMAVLHERKHIEWFIWANVLSLGFFGVKGGLFTVLTGGAHRVWGPPGSFIEDNNALALALVLVFPLINYLRLVADDHRVRYALIGAMLLCAAAILGSHSRGAFLAVSAMAFLLWRRSPQKMKFAVPLFLVGLVLLTFMPDTWVQRMQTIQNYQEDQSAMNRISAWATMIAIANDRLFGGGFDLYSRDVFAVYGHMGIGPIAAHSIYFQVLGEHGWIGLAIFVSLWVLGWRAAAALRRAAQSRQDAQWMYHLAGMCQVSLIGYAVGGTFLSLAYFDLPYNVLVLLVVAQRWLDLTPIRATVLPEPGGLPISTAIAPVSNKS